MRVGSRYGDFSRFLFDEDYDLSGVLVQQGRVQLDSDWNALTDLMEQRATDARVDVIGRAAAPYYDAGFKVHPMVGLSFDGAHDLIVVEDAGDAFAFSGDQPFTLEAWICLRRRPFGGAIFSHLGGPGRPCGYRLGVDGTGHVRFGRWTLKPARPEEEDPECQERPVPEPRAARWVELVAAHPVQAGRLAHVAATFNGRQMGLYLDGALVAREEHDHPTAPGGARVLIGCSPPGPGEEGRAARHFHGLISGVGVWRRALDGDEVRVAIHADRTGHVELRRGLVADWPFDDGKGDVAHDRLRRFPAVLGGGVSSEMPRWVLWNLAIGPGRYYVDGALATLREGTTYTQQKAYPCAALPPPGHPGNYLAVLDVWERSLSWIQDPSIREVALGGPDTTTRSQLVSSVRLLPLPEERRPALDAPPQAWDREAAQRPSGRMRARRCHSSPVGNYLYRVEVHDTGTAGHREYVDGSELVEVVEVRVEAQEIILASCDLDIRERETIDIVVPRSDGLAEDVELDVELRAEVLGWDHERCALTVDLDLDVIVEIEGLHVGRRERPATFKWSRLNGSAEFPIEPLQPKSRKATLRGGGPQAARLAKGDWVEIVDDWYTLQGRAHHLVQIADIDHHEITFHRAPPPGVGTRAPLHPFLRKWDQTADAQVHLHGGAVPIEGDAWIALEDGIEVGFEAGARYRTGDFWWIPARADLGSIEWPRDTQGPRALAPVGIRHRRCPLALLHIGESEVEVFDLRRTFYPMSSLVDVGTEEDPERSSPPAPVAQPDAAPEPEPEPAAKPDPAPVEPEGVPVAPEPPEIDPRSLRPEPPVEEPPPSIAGFPPGGCLLSERAEPPAGFVYTGFHAVARGPRRVWTADKIPGRDGELVGTAGVGGHHFLFTASGVWQLAGMGESPVFRARLDPPRWGYGIGVVEGRVHLVGGITANSELVDLHTVFTPATGMLTDAAPLPTARTGCAVGVVGGALYAVGGVDRFWVVLRHVTSLAERYDPGEDRWASLPDMPTARTSPAAVTFEGRLHVLGGSSSHDEVRPVQAHERFDPASGEWARAPELPVGRASMGAAVVQDALWVVGGQTEHGWTRRVDVYGADHHETWRSEPRLTEFVASPSTYADGEAAITLGVAPEGGALWAQSLRPEPVWFIHRKLEIEA